MAIDRTTRETKVMKYTRRQPWQPPIVGCTSSSDGFEHRWIRTTIRGEDDKSNVF